MPRYDSGHKGSERGLVEVPLALAIKEAGENSREDDMAAAMAGQRVATKEKNEPGLGDTVCDLGDG